MQDVEAGKAKLLADSNIPVPGLSVENDTVTYNSVPVDQLSTSEKVRVGASIAVAQNPKAKIILADDVSLLDKSNLDVLHETCKGYQLWQVVNDESGDVGFYIEQGELKQKEVTEVAV